VAHLTYREAVARGIAQEMRRDPTVVFVRITTPHLPLPAAGELEDLAIPSIERIATTIHESLS
jgi:pyruvate/2-oxoglutarate/acetoin dehydrogenase E1 component